MRHLIVHEQDPAFLAFASEQLQVRFEPALCRTIAHVRAEDDGTYTLLCVLVANNWTTAGCELSIASRPGEWATRRFINAGYQTFFYRWGKERIFMVVEPSNTAAIAMHERLGHKYEAHLEDWFGRDKPALLYGLTKRAYEQSKWRRSEEDKHELPTMEA